MSAVPTQAAPMQRSLRVIMVPASFDPRLHYQEVVFAKALHELGHELTVFTSCHSAQQMAQDWAALDAALPYQVVRSRRVLRVKSTEFPWDRGISRRIRECRPEVAVLLGPIHGLGVAWMKHLPRDCRVVSGFSDIPWHRGRRGLADRLKRHWARRVFRRSSLIISATVETTALLQEWGGPLVEGKIELSGLSFEPETLATRGDLPPAVAALRARVEKLGALVTRIIPEKELDVLFRSVEKFLLAHPAAGFVIGGFQEDAESARVREVIASSPVADRCVLLPMLSSHQIGDLFRMADFTLWSMASIGLYHALACGCPVVLRSGVGSAQHLVREGETGVWFPALDDAAGALARAAAHPWDRTALAESVSGFFTRNMVSRLLADVMQRPLLP